MAELRDVSRSRRKRENAEGAKTVIPENMSPGIVTKSPPMHVDDAAARICEYTRNGLEGLISLVFANIEQLHLALTEAGYRNVYDELRIGGQSMKSTNAVTYQMIAVGIDGAEWTLIVNSTGNSPVEVTNCIKSKEKKS
jgi:hypothetical protein